MSASSEYREQEEAAFNALPVLTRCALCEWTHYGAASEGRVEAAQHRAEHHPEMKNTRRRSTRNLGGWRQRKLQDWEEQEIRLERNKRAKLLGIE